MGSKAIQRYFLKFKYLKNYPKMKKKDAYSGAQLSLFWGVCVSCTLPYV